MVVAYFEVLSRIYMDKLRKKNPVCDFLNNEPLLKNEVHLT
jgi:hypothetical protein